MTSTRHDEPVAATEPVDAAGSTASTSAVQRTGLLQDLLRVGVCLLLVAMSVASPGAAPVLAPFVPALVAIRMLRQREGAMRFLVLAAAGALVAAGGAALDASWLPVAIGTALALVPVLGLVHVRAARRDPVDTPEQSDWPEPRIDTGFMLTIWAWSLALVICAVLAIPAASTLDVDARDVVDEAYSVYTTECATGGSLVDREEFCSEVLAQRDGAREVAARHAGELLGAMLAMLAFGAAATSHLIVLARARRSNDRIRPAWRARELEVHWIAAYLLAIGIVAWLVVPSGDATWSTLLRATGVGIGTLGALMLLAQGIGFVAWTFTRGPGSKLARALLIIFVILFAPVAAVMLGFLGMFDQAVHPRRRSRTSGSVPGRGSGS